MSLELHLGIKTDPIEYRYSHAWLFRLLAEEDVRRIQVGTHFEMYQLPDENFLQLREEAEKHGIEITSMFTAHRELGGFFRQEPGYEQVARRNYERLIEVGQLLGVTSVGSNPGAVLRDQMATKDDGVACYMKHMKELMHYAKERGLKWLTIEPMSCLAEPPTLPDEVEQMGRELAEYHQQHADSTVQVGYCTDIAHGYIDQQDQVQCDHVGLFKPTLPYLYEIHLKNTDAQFNSTFGFSSEERAKGIVDVPHFRQLLLDHADQLPVNEMTGYLEVGGPKLGRDYSDHLLESQLRESLRYLKESFLEGKRSDDDAGVASPVVLGQADASSAGSCGTGCCSSKVTMLTGVASAGEQAPSTEASEVLISPSMMCADPMNFEASLRQVEEVGVDMLHLDIMDGHFVPNMPMGLAIVEQLRDKTTLPLDVHLMVEDNDFFIDLLADMGVHQISVHAESSVHLDRTLTRIREIGALAGVAINPATPLSAIEYVLDRLDYILVMTVNPGYAGQKMTPASIIKIADCYSMLDMYDRQMPIQVDGNVSFENIPSMVAAGGCNLVAGTSSLFHKSGSLAQNMQQMREAIDQGLATREEFVQIEEELTGMFEEDA